MNNDSRRNSLKVILGIGMLFLLMVFPLKFTQYTNNIDEALRMYISTTVIMVLIVYIIIILSFIHMLRLIEIHMTIVTAVIVPLIFIISYFYFEKIGHVLIDFISMVYTIIGSVLISIAIERVYKR